MNWHDLFTALALVLIIEGLLPFTLPDKVKGVYRSLQDAPSNSLRTMGLASILAGLALLYFV
ncbi:MAG TPA: DUF2065 domain-containing protein [Leucothrix mucor]|uniref:DUF2065 domain-containing protein n=1 Tax=Leucothrix mucor TaxID=45248 RepID=A0A7V2SZG0_LEUMU|nr:DUF2065 domain-containing protein [Leucothrix mucor]